jgi:hypothetical protein
MFRIASNDFNSLSAPEHPLSELALQAVLDSLPVILFGGILFWWFGEKKN